MTARSLTLTCLLFLSLGFAPLSAATSGAEGDLPAFSAEPLWGTDLEASLKEAKASQKIVLLDFTGSDWCGWCKRLHEEVFSQAPFLAYAKENLVLQVVDFPRKKSLAPDVQQKNEDLRTRFKVDSYPTIVFLDGEGKELGRLAYMYGGAKTFVRAVRDIKEPQK